MRTYLTLELQIHSRRLIISWSPDSKNSYGDQTLKVSRDHEVFFAPAPQEIEFEEICLSAYGMIS